MRNAQGYAVIVNGDRTVAGFDNFRCETITREHFEVDTFQCIHCSRHIHVKAMAPMDQFGSMCRNCMKMVCPTCADGPCVPFMKKIEEMEKRDYIRRQNGL